MRTRNGVLPLALALVLSLAGCGDGTADDTGSVDWAASTDPVETGGLIWADAAGGLIHLADGSTLDAQTSIASYVVAGDGAYVIPDRATGLLRVTAEGVEETDAHADTLKASPDGRFLLFLDSVSGARGKYDDRLMQSVVVDLERGEEVVRTSESMGDPLTDDLRDLYEDATPGLLGITYDSAYVQSPSGVVSIDLPSGAVSTTKDAEVYDTTRPWFTPRYQDDLNEGPWNPAHDWAIDQDNPRDRFVSVDGQRLAPTPGTPTWSFERWIDDGTAVGYAVDAPPYDGFLDLRADRILMTCTVPDGACTLVPEATGPLGTVLLPNGSLL